MSKFKVGDNVRVIGVTDIDHEFSDGAQFTDPTHEITMDWQDPQQTLIGQVGVIAEAEMCDYYDVTVRFGWCSERESCAMKEQALEKL